MNDQISKWRNISKVCFETLAAAGKRIEKLKIYFDVLVILVMVWAIYVSRDANRIAREALQNSDTPWVQITSIGLDEQSRIKYVLVNFSDAPALRMQVDLEILGIGGKDVSDSTYSHDVLMPHDSGTWDCRYHNVNWDELKSSIKSGKASLLFHIRYESVQGRRILVEQEGRWIEDGFKDIKYEAKIVP